MAFRPSAAFAFVAVVTITAAAQEDAATSKAREVLDATRQTLGVSRLASTSTITARGSSKRVRGNNLVPIEFEMSIGLPDKYVRKEESPAEETDPQSIGFNGATFIQYPPPAPPAGRPGGPAPSPAQIEAQQKARLATAQQDAARLWLGLFADGFGGFPLTFTFVGQAAAPEGTADVLDVKGPGTFKARYFVSRETHLPLMVSWTAPPTNVIVTVPGQPPPATIAPGVIVVAGPERPPPTASQAEREAYTKQVQALQQKARVTPIEQRLYFADYREVGGLHFPFRLRRSIGSETTEETQFDRFQLNAKIPAQRFETGK